MKSTLDCHVKTHTGWIFLALEFLELTYLCRMWIMLSYDTIRFFSVFN